MGSGLDWEEICNNLMSDFYCVAVDLPGHGRTNISGNDSDFSMEKTTEYVINLIRENNLVGCHLVGYSMGGRLAIFLAVNHSEIFNKVIIESANPGIILTTEKNRRKKHDFELSKKLETQDFMNFLSDWYNRPIFTSLKNSEKFAKLLQLRKQNNPVELAKSIRGMSIGNQTSLWENLQSVENQVLLICGEFDHKYQKIILSMNKKIKFSEKVIISKSGHNTHFENTAEFIKQIKKITLVRKEIQ